MTVLATSYMTLEAVRAADALEVLGYSATVLDLRVLRPLMLDKVLESVDQTGRLLTVDTGFRSFGIGAEVVSEVVANCFYALEIAPVRMGLSDHPTPSSRGLVPGYYPDSASILRNMGLLLEIDDGEIEGAVVELTAQRRGLPIDVPDPFFKGPF